MYVREMGRDEREAVFQNPTSSVISNSGQNACWAPSSARSLLKELKRSQTSFLGHKCIKNVWLPGSARTRWGSLSAPPDALAANVATSRPGGGQIVPSHCFPPLVATTNRTLHTR